MHKDTLERIKSDPNYHKLVSTRTSFALLLASIVLCMYYAFVLTIAFDKKVLAAKLADGATTIGMPLGFGIIIVSFILTGIYTWRANTEFDRLSEKIRKNAQGE